MPDDIHLTTGNDTYVEPDALSQQWIRVFGLEGDDIIKMFQGWTNGGPGNDRIERLAPETPYSPVQVSYFDSPAGVRVNLAEGWAQDGWGTQDTLMGVDWVIGSYQDDYIVGNASDNFLDPRSGEDTIEGGAGIDIVQIVTWWQEPLVSNLFANVSADGRSAVVAPIEGSGFRYQLHDVEAIRLWSPTFQSVEIRLADLLTIDMMAQQTIAAGPDNRWNLPSPLGTPVTLTYSFVTSAPSTGIGASGFRAFTPAEQQFVREILAKAASFSGLTFNEVAEAGNSFGQLRFGVSQQPDTRGQAAMPGQQGDLAGDVWMDVETMANLAPGSEGWQALLHEIGHALGLRHPRNTDPGDAWPIELIESYDRPAMSVMSGRPSTDGLWRADWGPLDVLALRYLYGARTLNLADSVYRLGGQTGLSETTIVDDGGVDTLDASDLLAGASIRLTRGAVSDAGVNALGSTAVDDLAAIGDSPIENAIGTRFDDVLVGNFLDNQLTGGLGNDQVDGGGGFDTAIFAGSRTDYELSNSFGTLYVRSRDGRSGVDALTNIERLRFADRALDLAGHTLSADARFTLAEDDSVAGALATPSDVTDRSAVAYALVATPLHGSAAVSSSGQFSYRPAPDYWGDDHFEFSVTASGSSNRYLVFLTTLPANDLPTGALVITGAATVGQQLSATSTLADADGLGTFSYQWLREGQAIAGATNGRYEVAPPDFGARLSVSVSYIDGNGTRESATAPLTAAVMANATTVSGSDGRDSLTGSAIPERLVGLDGNDVLVGNGGADTLDGGDGFDVVSYPGETAIQADLRAGTVRHGNNTDSLVAIEAIFGSAAADTLIGADGPATQRGETLRGGAGNDTLDGGTGVDTAEFLRPRSEYTVTKLDATTWTVRDNVAGNGDEGTDRLVNIERIVFADQMLSFGDRAEELARVAFVLWTKDIVGSATLFSRGLSFYDVGYDFETMSVVAMQFWTADSDSQLAQRLITNSGSTKAVAQLLATMATNGGSVEGRAAAVREVALDPATTQLIEQSGIRTIGLVSDHFVPGFGRLFDLLPPVG